MAAEEMPTDWDPSILRFPLVSEAHKGKQKENEEKVWEHLIWLKKTRRELKKKCCFFLNAQGEASEFSG